MDLLLHSIKLDWPVLTPIAICSILVVAVVIKKIYLFSKNKRDINRLIPRLQRALAKKDFKEAQEIATDCGGVYGIVIREGVRIFTEQREGFSRSFDIAAELAIRKLERFLTILGTIGGVAPFLGLFGTVVRILYTFQDLAVQGNQSAAVAMGIGSALIATAFGLGVAIVAVIFYNSFQSIVKRYEENFQLIKLLFLSFADSEENETSVAPKYIKD